MRRVTMDILIVSLILGAAGASGCSGAKPATTHTVSGTLALSTDVDTGLLIDSLPFTRSEAMGKQCWGDGGYSDIKEGANITVKNGSGSIVATGALGTGTVTGFQAGWSSSDYGVCEFSFRIAAVPDADFYSIEVSHRGAVTFSRADLVANDWTASLTLGD